jgi:hypothetical protein
LSARAPSTIHQGHDFIRRAGGAQGGGEVLLDQRAGELGQQLQVLLVSPGRRGNEEDQVSRPVLGPEADGGIQPGHGQGRFQDSFGAAVRDGDAAGNAGGSLLLAGNGVRVEAVELAGAAVVDHQPGQLADDLGGAGTEVPVQRDELWGDEAGHRSLPCLPWLATG